MRFALPISILTASLVAGAASLSATAADAPKTQRACFLPDDIRNWKSVEQDTRLNLTIGNKDVYTAEFFGNCPGVDFNNTLVIKNQGASSFICEGDMATLFLRQAGSPQRCELSRFRKLTVDEIAALTKQEKP